MDVGYRLRFFIRELLKFLSRLPKNFKVEKNVIIFKMKLKKILIEKSLNSIIEFIEN